MFGLDINLASIAQGKLKDPAKLSNDELALFYALLKSMDQALNTYLIPVTPWITQGIRTLDMELNIRRRRIVDGK